MEAAMVQGAARRSRSRFVSLSVVGLALAGAAQLAVAPAVGQTHRTGDGGDPSPAQPGTAASRPATATVGFGAAIAVGEGTILVGRPGEVDLLPMPASRPGGVHVFRRRTGGAAWEEGQVLASADAAVGDGFGRALALEGDLLLAGAPGQEGGRGAAYAFRRAADGEWVQTARLAAGDGAAGDEFGFAVALAGDWAFVGAPGHDDGRGAIYLFRRDPATGSWEAAGKLRGSRAEPGDRFGASVAAREGLAVVGAPGPRLALEMLGPPVTPEAGAAYAFRHEEGGWREEVRLTAGRREMLSLGSAVLLGEGEAFISAPGTGSGSGAVAHFRRDAAGRWQRSATLAPSAREPGAMFGAALARAGDELLVGAPGGSELTGRVHVLRREPGGGGWREVQQLSVEAQGLGVLLGSAMGARAGLAVLGAPGAALFEGVAYLFARDPDAGRWSRTGALAGEEPGLEPVVGAPVECRDGSARLFPCRRVDLLAFLPVRSIGGKRGVMVNDVWGWTDPETSREYALVGRTDATAFVDVTDPSNPVYVGELPLTEGAVPNLWRDIKVYADHAFVVADGAGPHGVQVFDLTRLREVRDSPVVFRPAAVYDGVHSAHNIAINEETGFAYAVGGGMGGETCGGGLHMIDIRDPKRPRFAGCHADPRTGNARTGYVHDAQCVVYRGPDARYRGREICFNASETAVGIADVTDKENPRPLAMAAYPNVGYAHQGWLTEDHGYFFLNDELDEVAGLVPRTRTLVWDVQDLEDPVVLTEYLGTTGATDHNLYIRGRTMYQSNYVSGLRVLDISDPANPEEVGFFDTVPWGEDVPGFAGSWSNYPFFESGTIVVTSMREGLFLLRER